MTGPVDQVQHQRPADLSDHPVGELDQRQLAPGAVGHLAGQLGGGLGVELTLEVVEQLVPAHRFILPQQSSGRGLVHSPFARP
ncbi:MAG: hypothetical protein ABIV05_06740 [Actinomycetota bacterium]